MCVVNLFSVPQLLFSALKSIILIESSSTCIISTPCRAIFAYYLTLKALYLYDNVFHVILPYRTHCVGYTYHRDNPVHL